MSNNDQDLLDQILEETNGRKSRPEASTFTDDVLPREAAVTDSKQAKATDRKDAAEQAVDSEPTPSSNLQRDTKAQQAAVPEQQAESGGTGAQSVQTQHVGAKDEPKTAQQLKTTMQTALPASGHSDTFSVLDAPNGKLPKPKRKKFSYVDVLRGLFPWKGDSILEGIRKIVFLVSVIGFSVCLNLVISYYLDRHESAQLYDGIAEQIGDITIPLPEESSIAEGSVTEYLTMNEIGEKLLAQNKDTVGYISIPGTKVNYPVVQRKNEADGNTYYLRKSFNLNENEAGSVFLDYRCSLDDVVDHTRRVDNSTNLVIYGHNMEDGSMFGSLKYYRNDWGFYEEHPIIVLNSCYKTYTYKIFGYYIADGEDTTETAFDYWNTLTFPTEDDFYNYVNNIKRRSLRNTNVDLKYGDELISLSTCHGMFDTAKLVVVGRMVRPGEDPYEGTKGSSLNDNILWPTIYYRWNHTKKFDPELFTPYTPAGNSGDATTSAPENTGTDDSSKADSKPES